MPTHTPRRLPGEEGAVDVDMKNQALHPRSSLLIVYPACSASGFDYNILTGSRLQIHHKEKRDQCDRAFLYGELLYYLYDLFVQQYKLISDVFS